MAEKSQRISWWKKHRVLSSVTLASSELIIAVLPPESSHWCSNLWGGVSLTSWLFFLHPEFLHSPFGLASQLCSSRPPATPDHLPAGGAWHQCPFQADHGGPGGHGSSWLTGSSLPVNKDKHRGVGSNVTTRWCCFKRESGTQHIYF